MPRRIDARRGRPTCRTAIDRRATDSPPVDTRQKRRLTHPPNLWGGRLAHYGHWWRPGTYALADLLERLGVFAPAFLFQANFQVQGGRAALNLSLPLFLDLNLDLNLNLFLDLNLVCYSNRHILFL